MNNPASLESVSFRYLPALDGLRAIAIMLVLFAHAGLGHIVPGGLGVIIFFVISGFLISRLMIAEIAATGTLNIHRFYLRRILRLFPALLLLLAVFTPLSLALGVTVTPAHIFSAVFYVANYYHMYIGYPAYSPFPILWSLAVEEHFYIVFPFLVRAFQRDFRKLLPWLGGMAGAILLWRFVLNAHCQGADAPYVLCGLTGGARIYKGSDSIMDCILIGAIMAFALHRHPQLIRRLFINRPAFWAGAAILLSTLLIREENFRATLRYTLQSAASAVLIVNILFGNRTLLTRMLEHPWLIMIGRWSYALYLFHFAVAMAIGAWRREPHGLQGVQDIALYFGLTFLLAALTYHGVEKPVQALRRRFRAH